VGSPKSAARIWIESSTWSAPGPRLSVQTALASLTAAERLCRRLDARHEQLVAGAADMHDALAELVSNAREQGMFGPDAQVHRVGCECGICAGIRALARYEQGGRCILCGCTQDDGCGEGCAWVDDARLLCTAHPRKVLLEGRRFVRRWLASFTPKKVA
jgi:hypothetical protein